MNTEGIMLIVEIMNRVTRRVISKKEKKDANEAREKKWLLGDIEGYIDAMEDCYLKDIDHSRQLVRATVSRMEDQTFGILRHVSTARSSYYDDNDLIQILDALSDVTTRVHIMYNAIISNYYLSDYAFKILVKSNKDDIIKHIDILRDMLYSY